MKFKQNCGLAGEHTHTHSLSTEPIRRVLLMCVRSELRTTQKPHFWTPRAFCLAGFHAGDAPPLDKLPNSRLFANTDDVLGTTPIAG